MGPQLLCGTQGHSGTMHIGGLRQQSQPSQFQEAYQGSPYLKRLGSPEANDWT